MKPVAAAMAAVALLFGLTGCRIERVGWEEVVQVAPPWTVEGLNAPNGCKPNTALWAVRTQRWTVDKANKPVKDGPQRTYCVNRSTAVATKVGQTWNGE